MLVELSFVARLERVGFHEALGESDDAELEAAPALDHRSGAARDLNASAADVDHHGDIARHADAVRRGQMDEPGLFGPGNHARTNAGLLRHGIEELAAVL